MIAFAVIEKYFAVEFSLKFGPNSSYCEAPTEAVGGASDGLMSGMPLHTLCPFIKQYGKSRGVKARPTKVSFPTLFSHHKPLTAIII